MFFDEGDKRGEKVADSGRCGQNAALASSVLLCIRVPTLTFDSSRQGTPYRWMPFQGSASCCCSATASAHSSNKPNSSFLSALKNLGGRGQWPRAFASGRAKRAVLELAFLCPRATGVVICYVFFFKKSRSVVVSCR